MSDRTNIDSEQVIDSIRSQLSIPESGTVRRDIRVSVSPHTDSPEVSIQAGIPTQLAQEIIDKAEERVDLRRRGKIGIVVVDLDDETWELEIEGENI